MRYTRLGDIQQRLGSFERIPSLGNFGGQNCQSQRDAAATQKSYRDRSPPGGIAYQEHDRLFRMYLENARVCDAAARSSSTSSSLTASEGLDFVASLAQAGAGITAAILQAKAQERMAKNQARQAPMMMPQYMPAPRSNMTLIIGGVVVLVIIGIVAAVSMS